VKITRRKYAGHTGMAESNVYQRTVDYLDEWAISETAAVTPTMVSDSHSGLVFPFSRG